MGMWLEKVVKAEGGHRGSQKVNGIRDLLKPVTSNKINHDQ